MTQNRSCCYNIYFLNPPCVCMSKIIFQIINNIDVLSIFYLVFFILIRLCYVLRYERMYLF